MYDQQPHFCEFGTRLEKMWRYMQTPCPADDHIIYVMLEYHAIVEKILVVSTNNFAQKRQQADTN